MGRCEIFHVSRNHEAPLLNRLIYNQFYYQRRYYLKKNYICAKMKTIEHIQAIYDAKHLIYKNVLQCVLPLLQNIASHDLYKWLGLLLTES